MACFLGHNGRERSELSFPSRSLSRGINLSAGQATLLLLTFPTIWFSSSSKTFQRRSLTPLLQGLFLIGPSTSFVLEKRILVSGGAPFPYVKIHIVHFIVIEVF